MDTVLAIPGVALIVLRPAVGIITVISLPETVGVVALDRAYMTAVVDCWLARIKPVKFIEATSTDSEKIRSICPVFKSST